MFDIDQHLDEIRNISVSPSDSLVEKAMLMVEKNKQDTTNKQTSIKTKSKRGHKRFIKKLNVLSLSSLISAPLVAAMLLFLVLNPISSQIVVSYTIDINPSVEISINRLGDIKDITYTAPEDLDISDLPPLKNMSVENAISAIITESHNKGYIDEDAFVLIGKFSKSDKQATVTKNQIYEKLSPDLKDMVNLLYINVTDAEKKIADKMDVSAGLYSLATLGDDVEVTGQKSLNEIIVQVEDSTNRSVKDLLNIREGPTIYTAPKIYVVVKANTAKIQWDYIDYAKNNYDGPITYQLVCADVKSGIVNNPTLRDEYRFNSWDKQPVDYSLFLDEDTRNKYYAIISIYDDGTKVVNDNFAFIP